MIQILSVQDIKQAELESYSMGESSNSLVKKAANSISDYIVTEFPKDTNTNIVIISGAGNNGNDGILAGCYLATKGYNVTIFRFKNKNLVLPDYVRLEINERNKTKDIEYFEFSNVSYFEEQLYEQLSLANIIVDSLLGIGMNRPLSEDLSNLVNIINSFSSNKNTVISIDIPTGILSLIHISEPTRPY